MEPQWKYGNTLDVPRGGFCSVKSAASLLGDPGKSLVATLVAKHFEKYEVVVASEQLEGQLKLIEWRAKTELPVVKVLFYKVLHRRLPDDTAVVQVAIETFTQTLASLPRLPLFKLLYVMKEAVVGFERLLDRFGPFEISGKMILINRNNKCRVWINENFTLNYPGRRVRSTEAEVVVGLARMFEARCVRSTLSSEFFSRLQSLPRLVEAIQYMENFTKVNKIVLPCRLGPTVQPCVSPKPKKRQTKQKTSYWPYGHQSLKKIPKFVMQIRQQRKLVEIDSKSFNSPSKKYDKNPLSRDHSQQRLNAYSFNDPFEVDYTTKSNISPKSPKRQISNFDKRQTKSTNNENKSPFRANQTFDKQSSSESINIFKTMVPRSQPFMGSSPQKKKAGFGDGLFFSKQEKYSQEKGRQYSNSRQKPSLLKATSIEEIKISQQTATTLDDFAKKRPKGGVSTRLADPPDTPSIHEAIQEGEEEIFEKNGWSKTVKRLVSDSNFRETIESHHDGEETFSRDYTRSGESLGLLGLMGKELKGSILKH